MHSYLSSSSSSLLLWAVCCSAMALMFFITFECPSSANALPLWTQQQQQQQQNCLVNLQPPKTDDPTKYYPWMAAIFVPNDDGSLDFICTGSIISANFVLTAAHCIQNMTNKVMARPHERLVHVGSSDKMGGHKFAVAEVIPHPEAFEHDFSNSYPILNDIGLLKLDTPIEFDNIENTAPICLGGNYAMGELALVAGWGGQLPPTMCDEIIEQTQHNVLQSGKVRIVPFSSGQCRVTPIPWMPDNVNDAGAAAEAKQICTVSANGTLVEKGDSGGPLLKYDRVHGWHQLGVTSYGECSMQKKPVIYTKVGAYCEWIAQATGNEAQCSQ